MGYTHYWYQQRSLTNEEWTKLCAEAFRIVDVAKQKGIELCGGEDCVDAEIDVASDEFPSQCIIFNGEPGCEPLYLTKERRPPRLGRDEKDGAFSFCKTQQLPYDAAVVTILATLKEIAPDAFKVESDGGIDAIRKEL